MIRGLPTFPSIITDVLLLAKYVDDIWASNLTVGKERMRYTSFGFLGETVDHEVMRALHDACKCEEEGLWQKKRMPQRIQKVYIAVMKDRNKLHGGNA